MSLADSMTGRVYARRVGFRRGRRDRARGPDPRRRDDAGGGGRTGRDSVREGGLHPVRPRRAVRRPDREPAPVEGALAGCRCSSRTSAPASPVGGRRWARGSMPGAASRRPGRSCEACGRGGTGADRADDGAGARLRVRYDDDDRGRVIATRNPHDPSRTAGGSKRRIGRARGGRGRHDRDGLRWRRLDPGAGGVVRAGRAEGAARPLPAARRRQRADGARVRRRARLTRSVRDTALALDLLQTMPRGGSFMPVARIAAAGALDRDPGRLRDRRLDWRVRPCRQLRAGDRGPRAGGGRPARRARARRRREVADTEESWTSNVLWETFLDDWVGSAVELAAVHPDPEPLLTPMVARHYRAGTAAQRARRCGGLRDECRRNPFLRAVPGAVRPAADAGHARRRHRSPTAPIRCCGTSRSRRGSPASATPGGTRCRSTRPAHRRSRSQPDGAGRDADRRAADGGFGGEVQLPAGGGPAS